MRETKFRGITEDGRIFHGGFSVHATGVIVQSKDEIALIGKVVSVQEYTGIKDKNGKEIYEGDIVKWRSHPDKTVEASEVKWSSYLKWILVWFADDFERDKNYPSTKDLGGHINSIEVIGNIYENKDLLK